MSHQFTPLWCPRKPEALYLLLLCLGLINLPSLAATIHVPTDQPTIQAGIDAAQNEDTVLVADGTYTGSGNFNVQIIEKSITLQSVNGPQVTTIDCQELGRGLSIGPMSNGNVTIEGFTITNGRNTSSIPTGSGGALFCTQAVVIIQDCLFLENQARYNNCYGGAITAESYSDLTVLNCSFIDNRASGWSYRGGGGAIACIDGTLTIDNCILSGNRAWGYGMLSDDMYGYGYGGAVYVDNSTAVITGSEISNNSCSGSAQNFTGDFASGSGGGVYGWNSSIEMDRCLVSGNCVGADAEYSAAVYGAGVCVRWFGSLTLQNCQFTDNYYDWVEWDVSRRGGGVYSTDSTCVIENCLFVANDAEQVRASSMTMIGCTVAFAKLPSYGPDYSGIYCQDSSISNCIVWNNPAPQLRAGSGTTIEYCDIEGGWSGSGNIDADPLFASGPLGLHYLSLIVAGQPLDSPCVDAGNPTSPMADGTTRTDSVEDEYIVDMGYHYDLTNGLYICTFPSHLPYIAELGAPSPEDRTIEILPCNGGTLEWQIDCGAPWLSLEPLSGVTTGDPDPVVVSVDSTGLSVGDYATTITVQASGALNTPTLIPVGLTVGRIKIDSYPDEFLFEEMINQVPAGDQVLRIRNEDPLPLNWKVTNNSPWLSMNPTSGQSTGEYDQVTLHVDSTGLAAGLHHSTITISDPAATNSPQYVLVTYTLREMRIGHQPDSFTFQCDHLGSPPPEQQLDVWNTGDGLMHFRLTDDAEWLSLHPNVGNSSGDVNVIRLVVEPADLLPGTYAAMITLTAEFATNSPQCIPVKLTIRDSNRAPRLIVGPGPGPQNPALIRVYPPEQDAAMIEEFSAYTASGYGATISHANLDSDYFEEILTGPGPGAVFGPHVRGFEVDGTPLPGLSFLSYGTNKYGVNVAGGNLDADTFDEIVTGAGPGAVFGPHVRAFNYDGTPGVTPVPGVSFFAYGTPKWGVNVAAGDIDGDGYDEIITGPGPGAVYGPHVRGWNVDGGPATAIPTVSFLAYGTNKFGVNVSAGDVDGDGIDEIVTGAGPGAVFGPHVRGWNYDGSTVTPLPGYSFFAWHTAPLAHGVNVFAGTDLNDDGRDELVAGRGPAPDADTEVNVFTYDGTSVNLWISLEAYPGLSQGTNVAAGRF
jgi:hypothetical protein